MSKIDLGKIDWFKILYEMNSPSVDGLSDRMFYYNPKRKTDLGLKCRRK